MREPVTHVVRDAPPWRTVETGLTECGREISDVAKAVSLQEFIAAVQELGQQRASFTYCMTCWGTARYSKDWQRCPSSVMARETSRDFHVRSAQRDHTDTQLDHELRAIAALIKLHPEEFAGLLEGFEAVIPISSARRKARS